MNQPRPRDFIKEEDDDHNRKIPKHVPVGKEIIYDTQQDQVFQITMPFLRRNLRHTQPGRSDP